MEKYYTSERNTQILIALMKEHGVKKVVVSPGATNVCFVGSLQQDPYFEIYSSVDERSAAYIACGLAAESNEPVALSCTGATASRNYLPGLTEAYYRKLPVLAVTSTQHTGRIGQLVPQVIDRTTEINDIARLSVQIPTIHDAEDEWACNVQLNRALLEVCHHGGGPVHINLTTTYSKDFSVKELPAVRVIKRYSYADKLPAIDITKIAILVGSHPCWSDELTVAVDNFCERYDGVVLCDHTSNYHSKYRINPNLLLSQDQYKSPLRNISLLIHIGEVSGAYMNVIAKNTWRISPDGEIRDTFRSLRCVFEMDELYFFRYYCENSPIDSVTANCNHLNEWKEECNRVYKNNIDLPFSNAWIAMDAVKRVPTKCVLHLGILNTLRVWNFFEIQQKVQGFCNTGGFGIDGNISSLIGASLADKDKIYVGIVGDLAFFYDMNALGNRHIGNNVRLMVINNGRGQEFRNYNHPAARFGERADQYMAAAGHYGNKSRNLIRHYATDLGFLYLSAETKEEYLMQADRFWAPGCSDRPILFEVFTDSTQESNALKLLRNLEVDSYEIAKSIAKNILGEKGTDALRKVIKG